MVQGLPQGGDGAEGGAEDSHVPGQETQERRLRASAAYDGSASIGEARSLASDFLARVQAESKVPVGPDLGLVLPLVVSELVTNVRKYAPGPYMLELELVHDGLAVSVWDSDPALPAVREHDPTRIGGHGLEIVTAVATSLQMRREAVGKRLTATLPLH